MIDGLVDTGVVGVIGVEVYDADGAGDDGIIGAGVYVDVALGVIGVGVYDADGAGDDGIIGAGVYVDVVLGVGDGVTTVELDDVERALGTGTGSEGGDNLALEDLFVFFVLDFEESLSVFDFEESLSVFGFSSSFDFSPFPIKDERLVLNRFFYKIH